VFEAIRRPKMLLCALPCALLVAAQGSATARAAEFEYPELAVTPRASERVELEARQEASSRWTTYLPTQVSALGTLTTALALRGQNDPAKDSADTASLIGLATGGGWLVGTLLLAQYYQPYGAAQTGLNELPRKSPREQLLRERMAEEAIQSAARVGRRLAWLSTLSNLGASAFMMGQATSSTFAKGAAAGSMALSLAPLVFGYRWGHVAHEQAEYKKRIYGPVASAGFTAEPRTGAPAPTLSVALAF
jgi:hypothetical protein